MDEKNAAAPAVGLLPFYLELYDRARPECRAAFAPFLGEIAAAFRARGIAVETAPVCRVAGEFEQALAGFERAGVTAVVTLHLAYSPSLEALEAFCRTTLPVLVLDTTMDASFGRGVPAGRIMYNHGIHGVMDFGSMLRRRRRAFEIVAGHYRAAGVMDRAAALVRALAAARSFRGRRLLRLGPVFAGMGDFAVPAPLLRQRFGLAVENADLAALDAATAGVSAAAVAAEIAADRACYACELDEVVHARSVRVGLGLRRLLEAAACLGFSVNFQAFDRADRPADTMPFLETAKAMGRGVGYAGEGDVLTAALVGALARGFGAVTFTEIFCPDWDGGALFLSHMGEISPAVLAGRPRLVERPFPFGKARNPAVLTGAVRPGPAVYVNLVPGPAETFSLIAAPVEILAEDGRLDPAMRDCVRAWARPGLPLPAFLEAYTRAGGTHHGALVAGGTAEAVAAFGRCLGLATLVIGRSGDADG